MVETNKFKKGILEVIRLSQKINFRIGTYQTHYLTEQSKFIVRLSNGTLEIDIDVARDCEVDSENVVSFKLQKIAYSYRGTNKKSNGLQGNQWNQIFRGGK